MSRIRKQHGSKVKARIALEASANNETLSEIARRHSVHPIQVGKWRKELIERAHELFTDGRRRGAEEQPEAVEALYEQIGRLKVENDFLKKNLVLGADDKRAAIEPGHRELSIAAQCELLGLSRSGYYYEPVPESAFNLGVMRKIDELSTRYPFYGSRQMCAALCQDGCLINRKRAQRLMRLMGLEAIYCKPKTKIPNPQHKIFPLGHNFHISPGKPSPVSFSVPTLCTLF